MDVTHIHGDCLVGLILPAKEFTDWDHLYTYKCHLPLFPIMLTDATSFKCTAVCPDLLDHLDWVSGRDTQL
jgi:hypothetical protein